MRSLFAPTLNACERHQRVIAKGSMLSVLVFACIAGAAQQFTNHYGLKWDIEMKSAGLWEHLRLDLLAIIYLSFASIIFCFLLYQHKRWTGVATALTSFIALVYFGGAAIAHGHAALRALSPGLTVSS